MGMNDSGAHLGTQYELDAVLKTRDRVIALFYASWCPFCIRFLPIFTRRSEQDERHYVTVRDDRDTLGSRYAVKILPTVIFFENGVVAKRLDGIAGIGLNQRQLDDFVASCPS